MYVGQSEFKHPVYNICTTLHVDRQCKFVIMDYYILAKICLFLLTITALSYIYHQGFFKITIIDQKDIHESDKKTSMTLLPRYLEQAKILIVAFPRL